MADFDTNSAIELFDAASGPEIKALWVFGYGSLCWNPGFQFDKAVVGTIRGYSRKFWQGNSTHRGTEQKPGRVATLVEHKDGLVHGVAFQVRGEAAMPYLTRRECKLGGYSAEFAAFHPVANGRAFTVVLYVATAKNALWMGDAPLAEIAKQITDCSGTSGHNAEYLLRLADFMRTHFPDVEDEHLFSLEQLVRTYVKEQNMCLQRIMGDGGGFIRFIRRQGNLQLAAEQQPEERVDSFQFTTRVPEKPLRCLNI